MMAKRVFIIAGIVLVMSIMYYSTKSTDGVYITLPESNRSKVPSMDSLLLHAVAQSENKYTVFISMNINKDDMKPLVEMLNNAAIPNQIIETVAPSQVIWYVLVAGVFDSSSEAQQFKASLNSRFNLEGNIVKYPSASATEN
jgi:cell division septation protein DedD